MTSVSISFVNWAAAAVIISIGVGWLAGGSVLSGRLLI